MGARGDGSRRGNNNNFLSFSYDHCLFDIAVDPVPDPLALDIPTLDDATPIDHILNREPLRIPTHIFLGMPNGPVNPVGIREMGPQETRRDGTPNTPNIVPERPNPNSFDTSDVTAQALSKPTAQPPPIPSIPNLPPMFPHPTIKPSSRYCHVCVRPGKRFGFVKCAKNVLDGSCRKIVCSKCFEDNGRNFHSASAHPRWVCWHCNNICPPRASCTTYNRTNKRRVPKTSRRGNRPACISKKVTR